MTWSIRKGNPEDKKKIIAFFKSNIWQSKDADKLYYWKYEENPAGFPLIWLATGGTNDKIISSGIMMPCRIQIGGKQVLGFQAVDAITHKASRRQGIFTALTKQQLQDFAEMKVPIVITFPLDKALSIVSKLGWCEIASIRRWAKPLKSKPYLSTKLGNNFICTYCANFIDMVLKVLSKDQFYGQSSKYKIKEIKEFDERFDVLWNNVSRYFGAIVVRNSQYLNWKYVNNPNKNYKIFYIDKGDDLAGFIVFSVERELAHIVDILTEKDHEIINHLIGYTVRYLRTQNVTSISFEALEGNFYAGYFKRFGFRLRPDAGSFAIYIPSSNNPDQSLLLNHRNWFITIGDRDV